ncbi:MAG: hypothetical protein ABIA02_01680, partial [Candidatus Falkowbacteria bacterium]
MKNGRKIVKGRIFISRNIGEISSEWADELEREGKKHLTMGGKFYIIGKDENLYLVSKYERRNFFETCDESKLEKIDGMFIEFETPVSSKGKHLWAY